MTALVDLRTKLRTEYIRIDPNGKIWSNDVLDWYINRAYTKIQKDWWYKWNANIEDATTTTIGGTQEYWLPSDYIALNLVRYQNQYLTKTDRITLKMENQNNPMVSGTPYQYYLYGGNIGFYPIPSTAMTIDLEYLKKLPKITTSQDSLFPEEFDDAICAYAKYVAFLGNNKPEAMNSLEDYNMLRDDLMLSYIYQDTFGTRFGYQRSRWLTRPDVYDYNR